MSILSNTKMSIGNAFLSIDIMIEKVYCNKKVDKDKIDYDDLLDRYFLI